ncbi:MULTISPECIES: hypothetical protein [unclassified Streptomyces]|uniref:hypothetical protein n=1 Tax=unclassified Streptomyces TaxID=2593676 RepID=UPI00382B3065
MPRPTAAQLSYGSVTVVFSTLAMLLLFRTSSDLGIVAIAAAGLALGLLVAVTVPARRGTSPTGPAPAAHQDTRAAHESGDRAVDQVQRTIPAARTSARVGEHSLRH